MALLKFESPKVIELRGFGVPFVLPQGPPMVSNEIPWCVPQTIHNNITLCPLSFCPKFYPLKYVARPKEKGFTIF